MIMCLGLLPGLGTSPKSIGVNFQGSNSMTSFFEGLTLTGETFQSKLTYCLANSSSVQGWAAMTADGKRSSVPMVSRVVEQDPLGGRRESELGFLEVGTAGRKCFWNFLRTRPRPNFCRRRLRFVGDFP